MSIDMMPPVIQAVGLACVPVNDMPPGTTLARKPVAAAVITLTERDDGHRDAIVTCLSDARAMEFPLPVLVNDALIGSAPVIITEADCDILTIEAASRRFFVESRLGALAEGQGLIDPVAMFGVEGDEASLCRRLGIPANLVPDQDVARWWRRDAPAAVEGVALTAAVSRLALWAHTASVLRGRPDAFFETLLPLRERLMDLDTDRPELKPFLASRPFNRAGSFASYYREYRRRAEVGDPPERWLTFEDGQSYV